MNLGIDEAGRGALIGSMFICGVIYKNNLNQLPKFKDSKLYTKSQIYNIFETNVKDVYEYTILEITPSEIDKININDIELNSFCKLINLAKPDFVYIDCPVAKTEDFKDKILQQICTNSIIYCENKMDFNNSLVALASIIAKYHREKHIEFLQKFESEKIGSGYPSDEITKNFIRKFPKHIQIRTKWKHKIK